MSTRSWAYAAGMLLFFAFAGLGVAWADQGQTQGGTPAMEVNPGSDLDQIVNDLQSQIRAMQQMIQSQNDEIKKLKDTLAAQGEGVPTAPAAAPVFDLNTFQDMLGTRTDWIKGMKQGGDLRLRMENFGIYNSDATYGAINRDRNRFRARLRYGIEKDLLDDFNVGFRIVTGSSSDPNSTNVTLGNPGYFNYKPVFFDKMYAIYKPHQLKNKGILKDVTLGGGKVENPFLKYATINVWDADVTPEGAYETLNFSLLDTKENKLKSTVNLGQFLVNENSTDHADAELFGYQVGLTYTTDALKLEKPVDFTGAFSYYQFINYFQTVGAPAGIGASGSLLRTNVTQGRSPEVLDFYHLIGTDLFGRHFKLYLNYTNNIRNKIVSGAGRDDDAYGIGGKYGLNKKPGDWEVQWAYHYIGANATAAAFADSDFGGPGYVGYTNRKGVKYGLTYRLTKNLEASLTQYVVMPVKDQNATSSSQSEKVFRSQADLVWKF